MLERVCRGLACDGLDPGRPLRASAARRDHHLPGLNCGPITERKLQRALAVRWKAEVLDARRLHMPLQRKLGDHLAAEGSKEIGVRQSIRSFQLLMALLTVDKTPQGMGVRMGVMGRG